DNAMAESFVDSFKTELIRDRVWHSNTAVRASAFVGQARRLIRSFFSEAWKLSIAALSKQSPRDPLDTSTPTMAHR
ncbi:MAG: hypothetical protein ACXVH3_36465, partial [Solirubrobacteraceae bacterium]